MKSFNKSCVLFEVIFLCGALGSTKDCLQENIFLQLQSWINETSRVSSVGFKKDGMKLFETLPCDEGSTWTYKYTGPKQKKFSLMNGQEISIHFSDEGIHEGYNHGLKTGICFELYDKSICEIHGTFKDGQLIGEGEIRFRNGTYIRSYFSEGLTAGRINYFHKEIDAEEYQPSVFLGLRLGDYYFRVLNNDSGIIISRDGQEKIMFISKNTAIECNESAKYPGMLFKCQNVINLKLNKNENSDILMPTYDAVENDDESFDYDTRKGEITHFVNHVIKNFIQKVKNDPLDELYEADLSQRNDTLGTPILSNVKFIEESERKFHFSASNFIDGDNQLFQTSEQKLLGYRTLVFISHGIIDKIQGHFVSEGIFGGTLKVIFQNRSKIEAMVQQNYIHGPARHYHFKKTKNNIVYGDIDQNYELESLIIYKHGEKVGPSYYFMKESTSFLFKKNETYQNQGVYVTLSNNNDTFMTCYSGDFKGISLWKGHLTHLVDFSVQRKLVIPEFKECDKEVHLSNEPLVDPLIEDPVESRMVYVNMSTISGEGLFAKRNIPRGSMFAYFGGYRIHLEDWKSLDLIFPQYWIKMYRTNEVIYLPDELGRNMSKYTATLGHKINHSFHDYNSQFVITHHPKYKSLIMGVEALEDIPQGSEILCYYLDEFHEGNPWFQDEWKRYYDDDVGNEHAIGSMGYGSKSGERIQPMLADAEMYKNFMEYAINELRLSPTV